MELNVTHLYYYCQPHYYITSLQKWWELFNFKKRLNVVTWLYFFLFNYECVTKFHQYCMGWLYLKARMKWDLKWVLSLYNSCQLPPWDWFMTPLPPSNSKNALHHLTCLPSHSPHWHSADGVQISGLGGRHKRDPSTCNWFKCSVHMGLASAFNKPCGWAFVNCTAIVAVLLLFGPCSLGWWSWRW